MVLECLSKNITASTYKEKLRFEKQLNVNFMTDILRESNMLI